MYRCRHCKQLFYWQHVYDKHVKDLRNCPVGYKHYISPLTPKLKPPVAPPEQPQDQLAALTNSSNLTNGDVNLINSDTKASDAAADLRQPQPATSPTTSSLTVECEGDACTKSIEVAKTESSFETSKDGQTVTPAADEAMQEASDSAALPVSARKRYSIMQPLIERERAFKHSGYTFTDDNSAFSRNFDIRIPPLVTCWTHAHLRPYIDRTMQSTQSNSLASILNDAAENVNRQIEYETPPHQAADAIMTPEFLHQFEINAKPSSSYTPPYEDSHEELQQNETIISKAIVN